MINIIEQNVNVKLGKKCIDFNIEEVHSIVLVKVPNMKILTIPISYCYYLQVKTTDKQLFTSKVNKSAKTKIKSQLVNFIEYKFSLLYGKTTNSY